MNAIEVLKEDFHGNLVTKKEYQRKNNLNIIYLKIKIEGPFDDSERVENVIIG